MVGGVNKSKSTHDILYDEKYPNLEIYSENIKKWQDMLDPVMTLPQIDLEY